VTEPRHRITEEPVEEEPTVTQPSSFPTRKVSAFGGVTLICYQVFDVIRDWLHINLVDSARELIVTAVASVAAWWVKERNERDV
jgi:hypothetical protein